MILVQATSSGFDGANLAKITINDEKVDFEKDSENHDDRGLHIVVLNPQNGKAIYSKIFDTYKSSARLESFIDHYVFKDMIIVAACKDECATNLSSKVKIWFQQMGSEEIMNLKYRQGFAFIGTVGNKEKSIEKRSLRQSDSASVTSLFLLAAHHPSQMITRLDLSQAGPKSENK